MMNWQNFVGVSTFSGSAGMFGILFWAVILWTLVWKGMALWKAAQEKNKIWFTVLLVVNTAGILEILYLYVFSKCKCPVCHKGKCECDNKEFKNVEQPKNESEAPKI